MDDIYSENILDHYKNPRNFGRIDNPDIESKRGNPFCGDQLSVTIKLSKGKKEQIAAIAFEGQGCAVSIAAASLLTGAVIGMKIKEVMEFKKEKVIGLLGI